MFRNGIEMKYLLLGIIRIFLVFLVLIPVFILLMLDMLITIGGGDFDSMSGKIIFWALEFGE